MGVGRGVKSSLDFEIWHFSMKFLAKKVVFSIVSGKKITSPFLAALEKILPTPMLTVKRFVSIGSRCGPALLWNSTLTRTLRESPRTPRLVAHAMRSSQRLNRRRDGVTWGTNFTTNFDESSFITGHRRAISSLSLLYSTISSRRGHFISRNKSACPTIFFLLRDDWKILFWQRRSSWEKHPCPGLRSNPEK